MRNLKTKKNRRSFKSVFPLKEMIAMTIFVHPPCDVVKEGFLSFTYLSFFLCKKHQTKFFAAGAETRLQLQTPAGG